MDGVEVEYWVNNAGEAGPPVILPMLPAVLPRRERIRSPGLLLSNKIGDLVEAQREYLKVIISNLRLK